MSVELVMAAADPSAGCSWMDAACWAVSVIEGAKSAAWEETAAVIMTLWKQLEMFMFSSWIATPFLIDITDPDGTVLWLQRMLLPLTFLFAVLGSLLSAGWTFIKLGLDKMKELGWSLGWLLLINTGGAFIIAASVAIVQALSVGLLLMVGVDTKSTFIVDIAQTYGPGMPALVGGLGAIGVFVQIVIMIARSSLIPVLTGSWPLSAAAATMPIEAGRNSFRMITAWLVAFVIYPFPAAIVFAAAFRMKTGGDGLGGLLYGAVLQLMAMFLMPAIFRIIAPQVQVLGKAHGGAIAVRLAAQATEIAVAIGAVALSAGAAAGAFAGKAGAAAAKSAGGAAPTGASGGGTPGVGGSGGPAGGPEGGAGGGGSGAPDARRPGEGRGATTVDASARTPGSGGGQTAPGTQGTGTRRGNARLPQPEQPNQLGTRRAQAAAQATQVASNHIKRSAQEGLDDVDEIIGGKNG